MIERERRRLAGEYDVSGYESSPTESAWQPEDRADNEHDDNLSTRLDTEFMRRLLNVADINADDVSGREVSSDEVNTTAEQSDAVKGDFDKDTRADTDASPSANEPIVDPEELKSIFQSSDVDGEDDSDDSADPVEKKTLPYQLGGPPAHEKKKRRSGFGEEDADDAVAPSGESAEIERLFEEAANNDALGDVTQLEAEVEARQLDGHREMETEEILPDGTDEITREAFDEQVVPGWNNEPVLSKEWVAEREDINEKPTVVRKRSDSWLDVGENPARQTGENVARPMEGRQNTSAYPCENTPWNYTWYYMVNLVENRLWYAMLFHILCMVIVWYAKVYLLQNPIYHRFPVSNHYGMLCFP